MRSAAGWSSRSRARCGSPESGVGLGLPQVKLGTIPAAGGTQRLPRMIGHGKALDLLVTGRTVEAEEAYAIGLVDRLAPEGEALTVAIELAREIASASMPAISAVRRAAAASARLVPRGHGGRGPRGARAVRAR